MEILEILLNPYKLLIGMECSRIQNSTYLGHRRFDKF